MRKWSLTTVGILFEARRIRSCRGAGAEWRAIGLLDGLAGDLL